MLERDSSSSRQDYQREPLNWEEGEVIKHGDVVGTINTARSDNGGKLYSYSIGKKGRRDGRMLKFMAPRDIADVRVVLDEIEDWIDTDKGAMVGRE